jgi:hypothetical protein
MRIMFVLGLSWGACVALGTMLGVLAYRAMEEW